MSHGKIYSELMSLLCAKLEVLTDKPEETLESTLRALRFLAGGEAISAQCAMNRELPVLTEDQLSRLRGFVDRRLNGEPLAYITGRQQFLGIELITRAGALIPRKETEILGKKTVEIIQGIAKSQDRVTVIDVCTGAGNLPVAYAMHEPKAHVFAADLSPEAVTIAKENVLFRGLESRIELHVGDLLTPFDSARFHNSIDVLTCNPPYISSSKVEKMHKEISEFEPEMAFDGGAFGVKILHRVTQEAPKYLRDGGYLLFEVGLGQGDPIINRLKKGGVYGNVQPLYDDEGNVRAVCAQMGAATGTQST